MKQTIILIFSLLALWNLALTLFPHLAKGEEYLSWQYKFSLLNDKKLNQKTVILGDSTAEAGVMPKYINGEQAYNLSLPGGTPFEAYLQMEKLIENNIKPKHVIVAFGLVNYLFDDGFLIQNINFGMLSHSELQENLTWQYENEFIIEDIARLESATKFIPFVDLLWSQQRDKVYQLSLLEYYLSQLNLSPIDYTRFKKNLIYNSIDHKSIRNKLAKGHGYLDYGDDRRTTLPYAFERFKGTTFTPHPFSDHYFSKLLELLSKNDIQVTVEMTPILEIYRSHIKDLFIKTAEDYLKRKAKVYGFQHLDSIQVFDDSFFADYVHLNKEGSTTYSKYLHERYFNSN